MLRVLAPIVAHGDEAVRAEEPPRVQGSVIFHIIQEQWAISSVLQASDADQELPSSRKAEQTQERWR